jgi:hypothetical protein
MWPGPKRTRSREILLAEASSKQLVVRRYLSAEPTKSLASKRLRREKRLLRG